MSGEYIHSRNLGAWAEDQALKQLLAKGFKLVSKNYHSRFGEIDLIVQDEIQRELIFVEVKARSAGSWGDATSVVSSSKQKKIIQTAMIFLDQYPDFYEFYSRFDVICFDFPHKISKKVQQDFSKLDYHQQWLENAFTLDA